MADQGPTGDPPMLQRKQWTARRTAESACKFHCCVICGLEIPTCLTVAHLDQNAGNNSPDNLAFLCQTHHWMYDAGLYPIEAIKLLRSHWQLTEGRPSHKARMKDAGFKAALARKRSSSARKAWTTRRRLTTDLPQP
ncbi:HNH endonuclease [Bradyrhizobium sp. U87765 SZCCT0131]|uniref:HNH endonuclease signature motif containing protein n=1 Tax=unclassified Bradyrhizobium TaxID=2631580 RepID=UPI001BA83CA2|nr:MULTISPECIES: HNH endonuclease signature motif containing protein [unclassified Bradyrhizobium]MBR1216691.1 HNH endonuclease [Bradyrhizobium sp. U87765 SZCCT0131]MBR1259553.1 HNH endonuclease [Bradyrhizobium sp. U87765 SZCCT0134]MBR1305694.1 HNH endonuclease [Bradyrhizobium sp. U87765 SZCCT0110]MBR1322061.1 HNH endonuclease [Bradyrhizobium sp. U87765 SZCCT0109]MBR1350661.1 HNH endonuclease [Bradyrhizobium sp. U87765 SZCCT0048]